MAIQVFDSMETRAVLVKFQRSKLVIIGFLIRSKGKHFPLEAALTQFVVNFQVNGEKIISIRYTLSEAWSGSHGCPIHSAPSLGQSIVDV